MSTAKAFQEKNIARLFKTAMAKNLRPNKAVFRGDLVAICERLKERVYQEVIKKASGDLAAFVTKMVHDAMLAILKGDDKSLRYHLSCQNRADWHAVVNGSLLELPATELRRKIVEVHGDVLVSERILDLESQVKSLTEQVARLNAEIDGN